MAEQNFPTSPSTSIRAPGATTRRPGACRGISLPLWRHQPLPGRCRHHAYAALTYAWSPIPIISPTRKRRTARNGSATLPRNAASGSSRLLVSALSPRHPREAAELFQMKQDRPSTTIGAGTERPAEGVTQQR